MLTIIISKSGFTSPGSTSPKGHIQVGAGISEVQFTLGSDLKDSSPVLVHLPTNIFTSNSVSVGSDGPQPASLKSNASGQGRIWCEVPSSDLETLDGQIDVVPKEEDEK